MELHSHIALRRAARFVPRERADAQHLNLEIRLMADNPIMTAVLNAAGSDMFILNRHLQIVAANSRILNRSRSRTTASMLGRRIGELLDCQNAGADEGCGGGPSCSFCGVLNTLLESRAGDGHASSECQRMLPKLSADTWRPVLPN